VGFVDRDNVCSGLLAVERMMDRPQRQVESWSSVVTVGGAFDGLAADVRIDGSEGGDDPDWRFRIHGRTHGVHVVCARPYPWSDGKNFTGRPDFDARFAVSGGPRDVLRHLMSADVCARLLACNAQLRVRDDKVECLSDGVHDEARLRAILAVTALVLRRLPDAIRASGAEPWLHAHGTFANHPDLVARRQRMITYGVAVAGAVGMVLFATFALVAMLILWFASR
jgi:hypothetical protein